MHTSALGPGPRHLASAKKTEPPIIKIKKNFTKWLTSLTTRSKLQFVRRAKQTKFALNGFKKDKLTFGGSRFTNYNPKSKRPLSTKEPIHVVMRSPMATGHLSLLFFDKKIKKIINKQAQNQGIRIYDLANSGNHLHFVCRIPQLRAWKTFIRAISGLIARLVLKAERGSAVGARFWQGRPWTRIMNWGRAYRATIQYLGLNKLEAVGFTRVSARALQAMGINQRALPRQSTA